MGILLKVVGSFNSEAFYYINVLVSCFTMTHHSISIRMGMLMDIVLKVVGLFQQRGFLLYQCSR